MLVGRVDLGLGPRQLCAARHLPGQSHARFVREWHRHRCPGIRKGIGRLVGTGHDLDFCWLVLFRKNRPGSRLGLMALPGSNHDHSDNILDRRVLFLDRRALLYRLDSACSTYSR